MRKIILVIAILALIWGGVLYYSSKITSIFVPVHNDEPVVKIGVLVPLTGVHADSGENVKAALNLALQDVKPSNVKVKYIFEDFGFSSPRAATAVHKLINIDNVNAIITWSAVSGSVVSPIADRAGVVHLGIGNVRNVAQGKYNFIHWTPSEVLADKMVELIESKNVRSVALFVGYQTALQEVADLVEKRLNAKGIIAERINFNTEEKDFNITVDKIKNKDLDVWYIATIQPSLDILLKTIFQKQVNKPLVSHLTFAFSNLKDLLEGAEYVAPPEGNEEMLQRVTKITGSTNYFSLGYVYDAGYILSSIYNELYGELGTIPKSEEVASRIMEIRKFNGTVGEITVDDDGVFLSKAVLKQIKNGKSVIGE